jgi:DNA-binding SARP family transcriptional activator/Tfp pilus assembly protein PilF
MEFRILGSLEVLVSGQRLPLGGQRERKMLAVLLLDANRVVPVTSLVDALWDYGPPATAGKQVRNAVSQLRRGLAAHGVSGVLETDGSGYRLSAADDMIDAGLFEARVSQAERAASAGRLAESASTLRSALDLWRGPALAGLSGRVIEAAATAWNERRCATAEAYHDQQLALGRHREIIGELTALVARHPLRERTTAQLMLALYRCGRPTEALSRYSQLRTVLADELGLDPGPRLRELQQQILTGDAALDVRLPEGGLSDRMARAGSRAPLAGPAQLPAAVRHFAGRCDELKTLTGLLENAADAGATVVISAISGTAGIGKTALAVHFAHQAAQRFPDGQLYVNLRGFDSAGTPMQPAEAVRGFLDALVVPAERVPADLGAQTALYRSLPAGKRMLVVLDNARHSGQVRPLIPGSPGCLVVVTSRDPLTSLVATEGACPLTLDLLTSPEARELLAGRLGAERLAGDPESVAELIRLCARLPLALSIAAARAASQPLLPMAALAAELRDARARLDALDAGDDAASVRSVFSWSYRCLSAPAARMFRLLGVHAGPDISAPAATSLAGLSPGEVRTALSELTRAHLLMERTGCRYAFHDLLRAYAAELSRIFDSDAERHAAIHRVLDHYLHTAHACARLLNPARDPIALAGCQDGVLPEDCSGYGQSWQWFHSEQHVLAAAIASAADRGFDTHAWQIPWALTSFFYLRGQWHDDIAIQHAALAAALRLGSLAGQAHAHRFLGNSRTSLGSYQDAEGHLRRALILFGRLDDRPSQAQVHNAIAMVLERLERHRDALVHARQALDLFSAAGHRRGQARSLNAVGWYHALLGNHADALAFCQRALGLCQDLGDQPGEAAAWDSLGFAHTGRRDHPSALDCYTRALELRRQLGDRSSHSAALLHLGDTYRAMGNYRAARRSWRQALGILEDLGHPDAERVRARLEDLDPAVSGDLPAARS